MPLVDYASSDEDQENEEENIISCNTQSGVKIKSDNSVIDGKKNGHKILLPSVEGGDSVFSVLPTPKINPLLLVDDNSLSNLLLNKKVICDKDQKSKGKVKISVPSVSDFDDGDSDPSKKKPKTNTKGSGLFSVLPPPKHNLESSKTFVSQDLSNSQNKKYLDAKTNVIKKYLKKSKETCEASEVDNDNDEMPAGSSFFGSFLTETSKRDVTPTKSNVSFIESEILPSAQSDTMSDVIRIYQENSQQIQANSNIDDGSRISNEENQIINNNSEYNEELVRLSNAKNEPLGLDDKALQILCGRKKNQQQIPMEIIDLSGEEIMPDSKEWLLKQLSQEKKVRGQSHRKSQGPSSQQRRKHQITYLAYQAKEQELELQNQWANNRMSRRQTQSKYGF